tara:strand:- start:1270 stop:1728 length:459 start_codon:yes stop_codon:yes gene_type:complete
MSTELDQYLEKQPIYQFKLMDGTTIVAKLRDIDDNDQVHLEEPHEVHYSEDNAQMSIALHKWMYMSDETHTSINLNHVLAYSELNVKSKSFYSKAILKAKVNVLADELQKRENQSLFSDVVNSIIDGLDNQDYVDPTSDWNFDDYNSDRWNI